ncbi:MAG: hypothetical protein COA90_04470 [Gammaproteobacteria bacterium]|nr:MAG: hypothetical protein COA90_04470 [Gammaproteobacteria bacterium]
MGDHQQQISENQVKMYLAANTDFFSRNPEALDSLQLEPSSKGVISLAQRQSDRLHDKNKQLQIQLHELIDNARQNTALQSRIHLLCLRLLDAPSFGTLLPMLMKELKHEFNADEVALRWFSTGTEPVESASNIIQKSEDNIQVFEQLLADKKPVCGRLSKAQKTLLFANKADKVQSVVCLPLGYEPCAGLLAIASYDEDRFHSNMATDYLDFLAEITMRLLRPHQ